MATLSKPADESARGLETMSDAGVLPGRLFVVATPIGNLGDITLRAVETLRTVAAVWAEDTRRTRALLSHLGIAGKEMVRIDAHADDRVIATAIERVARGADAALVTDAGTPGISDPGAAVVKAALAAGVPVVPIPGPCAAIAAFSVSGMASQSPAAFRFFGFLPRSGPERREAVTLIAQTDEPAVIYESPQRIAETLTDLAAAMPTRGATIARELTKVHEEYVRGPLAELSLLAAGREWRGEIVLTLDTWSGAAKPAPLSEEDLCRRIDEGLQTGRRAKDLAEILALETGLPRRELYARIVERRR